MSIKTCASPQTEARRYQRLTRDKRIIIYTLRKAGNSMTAISKAVGCSKSTISRELRRNAGRKGYRYEKAQKMAEFRAREKAAKRRKFKEEMWEEAKANLARGWSFEQTAGRARRNAVTMVCKETLYKEYYTRQRLAERGESQEELPPLPRRRKKRKQRDINAKRYATAGRGRIKDRVDIEERPAHVENRKRAGHWEGDLINGANSSGHIVTMAERMTRFTLVGRAGSKNTNEVMQEIIGMMRSIPRGLLISSAFDNGKEFAGFKKLERELGLKVYFAKPYHSWERGTNENRNGIVRKILPKGRRFDNITDEELRRIDAMLNDRPMKCLGWRTPREAFARLMANHAQRVQSD